MFEQAEKWKWNNKAEEDNNVNNVPDRKWLSGHDNLQYQIDTKQQKSYY